MKLLFIENRYATRVWALVAAQLQKDAHEVHWLVQNPVFRPGFGTVHTLPFPSRSARIDHGTTTQRPLKYPDRAVLFFGRSDAHHGWYRDAIERVIASVQPDVIIGESTQFHELLALEVAQQRGIHFLCPAPTRYPAGRMMFHREASMQTVGGSRELLHDNAARDMLIAIRERRIVLPYMRASQASAARRRLRGLADRALITWGWLRGDHYATPSPLQKFRLDNEQRRTKESWESFSRAGIDTECASGPWVLYPLQMQPESNIEVWGFPWFDQVEIVRRAADVLGAKGAKLVVKPNPKSKYEMSRALCELCASHPAIVPISHRVGMQTLLPHASLLLSVTGTVIMEAAFAYKAVAVLGDHELAKVPGVAAINAPEQVVDVLSDVLAGRYQSASEEQLVRYLQNLYAASYPGSPFDPLNQPEMLTAQNVEAMGAAFRSVLGYCAR